jgi:4-amino-4-deoxy-L-arabinose transferase-like glycosyltransferase
MPAEQFDIPPAMPVGVLIAMFVVTAILVVIAIVVMRSQPRRHTWKRDAVVLLGLAAVVGIGTPLFYVDSRNTADEQREATVRSLEDYYELDVTEVLDASEDELRFVAVDDGANVECTASEPGDFVMLTCDAP